MADQGTAARLIEVATAEVGTIEGPKDNETKYGAFMKANFQPWCGSFVNWCANEAGVKIPNTVYTPSGAQAFKKAGQWIDNAVHERCRVSIDEICQICVEKCLETGTQIPGSKDAMVNLAFQMGWVVAAKDRPIPPPPPTMGSV